jgi:hypothetical protein
MKKVLMIAVVMALGLALATPVLADHRDHYRGHPARLVRGGYHTVYYAPSYPRPKRRTSIFFGFGVPLFAPAPVYVYQPPPIVVGPGYCEPVFIPGHYVYDRGGRFYVAGYWSR